MIELSAEEQLVLNQLDIDDDNFGLFRVTKTGLSKSIFDATKEIRIFLKHNLFHDFEKQLQGQDHKKVLPAFLQNKTGYAPCGIHLNRPNSGNGDPRFWIPEIKEIAQAGDIFCLYISEKGLTVSKISASVVDRNEITPFEKPTDQESGIMDTIKPAGNPDFWAMLGRLWERATGGSDVAARPGEKSKYEWPSGPAAAGVETAIKWFQTESNTPKFLFLVGGPGGGKSFTAAKLVDGLTEVNPRGEDLAYRSHRYLTGNNGEIFLVNDATIGSQDYEEYPLAQEIIDSLLNQTDLIACVNRGILVEESKKLIDSFSVGQALIHWVSDADSKESSALETTLSIVTTFTEDYLKSGVVMENGAPIVEIAAVYVDACSLLEKIPNSDITHDSEGSVFSGSQYAIQNYSARKSNGLDTFPAGVILKETVEILNKSKELTGIDDAFNPFTANIQSLSNSQVAVNLLSVVRAAEIVSSSKFTYREIWGLICKAIVGNAPNVYNSDQIEFEIQSILPLSNDPLLNFKNFQLLAGYRFSQSVFGSESEKSNTSMFDPVLRLMKIVDPVLDSQPGIYNGEISNGWATPIVDAFSGPLTEGSPLESVLLQINPTDNFRDVITDFDWTLDKYFVEAMQFEKIKDSQRRNAISWYSMYISRLYAVSNGISAFANEVSNWLDLWKMSPNFPSDTLEKQFTTLIRPPRVPEDLNSSSLLPIFDSRTEPLRGDNARSKLSIRVNDVRFKTSRKGDSLFLHLEDHNLEVSKILLDFALVREALSCVEGYPGVTELSKNVAPRLERVRAANLVPKMLSQTNEFRIVIDGEEKTFSVERGTN